MTALAYFDYIVRTLQDRKLRNSVLDYIVSVTVNGDLIIDHLTILLLHTDAKVRTGYHDTLIGSFRGRVLFPG